MNTKEFVYWQDEGVWVGYLKEYPDYWTQGENFDKLKENLKDIFTELISGTIPNIRKTGELEIA